MSNTNPNVVKLDNVRLSFPSLFREKKFAPTDAKGSYSATFLLDKKANAKAIADTKRVIDALVKETFKGKHPGAQRVCLRDGSEKADTPGYGDGVMFVSARTDKRPPVVNRDMSPLTEDDGRPYAGCYVNATVEIWAQDNLYGRRINAKLRGVQFVKDGEEFGAGHVDANREFTALADDDESPV